MVWILIFLMLGLTSPQVKARDNATVLKRNIRLTDQKRLEVSLSFGAGTLYIKPGKKDELFRANLTFTRNEPTIDYSVAEGVAYLEINGAEEGKKDNEDKTFNISNFGDIKRNQWELYFSPDIPIKFKIETGASKNVLDFGGLRISKMEVSTGASETNIDFSKPNPIEMRRFTLEAGVSKVIIEQMLNANFHSFKFEGGVGSYKFYLSGPLKKTTNMNFEAGVSSTKLIVDPGIAFRAEVDRSFMSSVRVEEAVEEDDDIYVSDNFSINKPYLDIYAETGIGSFKIVRGR